jgi:LuxR family maltose regulon positive regulatory protein
LSQWVASHPELRRIWIDLDETDNDANHFEAHVLDAIAGTDRNPAILKSGSASAANFATDFITAICDKLSTMGESVIVLEDLHRLTNQKIVADIGRLIEMLPPHVHMLISSRADTPVALNRNRLRGEVGEIRQSAFAMTYDESAALLQAIAGRELDHASVAALLDRTEGWTAGLQMAAMTLRFRHDTTTFVAEFGGSDRLVADYLSEEVLDALSRSDRATLLEMSALDKVSAELLSEVTDRPRASDLLTRLERQSLFVTPIGDSREWFRFHPLFRDLLRYRMRSEDPRAEPRTLTRAAEWHLTRGDTGSAIEYFLRARNWERAIEMILSRGPDLFERADAPVIGHWLNAIPEDVIAERTEVLLLRGMLTATTGDGALAEDRLRAIAARRDITAGEAAYAQAFLAALVQWRPRPNVSIACAEQALDAIQSIRKSHAPDHLPNPAIVTTITMISLGRAHFLAGNLPEARQWLDEALSTDGGGYSVWRISALGSLALIEAWCGRTDQADEFASEALALANEISASPIPATAEAHLAAALVAIESANLKQAAAACAKGVRLSNANGRDMVAWVAFAELRALDDLHPSSRAPRAPAGPPPPIVADSLLASRSRALRLSGSPGTAHRLLNGQPAVTTSVMFEKVATELALGHPDVARGLMNGLPDLPDAAGPLGQIQHLILASWCEAENGMGARADDLLRQAMNLAEDNGLITVFVRAGPATVKRLSTLTDESVSATREAVLSSLPELFDAPVVNEPAEGLTERELELIALLPTRLTNTELADRFFISVNTVKTHMTHIYRKLAVSDRDGAITKAAQLGLLNKRLTYPGWTTTGRSSYSRRR